MWNRKYFLDSYRFHNTMGVQRCLTRIPEHALGYDYLQKECPADILLILAKFADEITADLKKDNFFTADDIEKRVDDFVDYIKNYSISLENICLRGGRTVISQKREIMLGRPIYRHYHSTFGAFWTHDYENPRFLLTVQRKEFKRIIYQFILDEEIDFQGFCIYLDYSKLHVTKLIYDINSAVNPYIKQLLDKDIPLKHTSALKNFTLTISKERLEEVMKDITSVL